MYQYLSISLAGFKQNRPFYSLQMAVLELSLSLAFLILLLWLLEPLSNILLLLAHSSLIIVKKEYPRLNTNLTMNKKRQNGWADFPLANRIKRIKEKEK